MEAAMLYLLLLLLPALIGAFLSWQNNALVVTRYSFSSPRVPEAFDGLTLCHLSDLHGKLFGNRQQELLALIRAQSPDVICVTGDLADAHRMQAAGALILLKGAERIAPVYFVTGNHDAFITRRHPKFFKQAEKTGAVLLNDGCIPLRRGDALIALCGVPDPKQNRHFLKRSERIERMAGSLARQIGPEAGQFHLLLTHRPEMLDLYAEAGVDLVLAGHAHGGQIRLPFLGGLYAPDQGVLPKYTAGKYRARETTMIVNRGLGNSGFPFRIFNRPEVGVVTLHSDQVSQSARIEPVEPL